MAPPASSLRRVSPLIAFAQNKSLASTLLDHELDAAHIASPWVLRANALDRSSRITGSGAEWGKIKPLFPDRMAEAARFQKQHGFLPVNHTYIIRGDIYQKHPWVAFNLYDGFVRAKTLAREKLAERSLRRCFSGRSIYSDDYDSLATIRFPMGSKPTRRCSKPSRIFPRAGVTPQR